MIRHSVYMIAQSIIGLAFFIFFLVFIGALQPAHAQSCDATWVNCTDTTPDYVLMIGFGRYGAVAITTQEFENKQACIAAGDGAKRYLPLDSHIHITTLCAPKGE